MILAIRNTSRVFQNRTPSIESFCKLPQLDFGKQHFLDRLFLLAMLAFRHLTSRPFRTALTVAGVGVGVAAALAIYLANQTVFESFQRAVTRVVGEATIHISGAERRLDETLIERIRLHP